MTKTYESAWVKLNDADGEFLLIEASGTLPAWLEPEVAENRVWISDGQLKIIKPAGRTKSVKRTDEKLSLQDALSIVINQPQRLMHSASIEEEAFYRLRNYPGQIKDNMHHAMIQVPRKVVFLLQQKPRYVASAIEAFYLRDPIALKLLQTENAEHEMKFPPTDLVTVSVKFPKVAYAQLKSQDFPIPLSWKSKLQMTDSIETNAREMTGMKLTCGFEILLSDSQYQDRSEVREMKLLLEDIDTGDMNMPTDEELVSIGQQQDDEKWLDINFDDFQHELAGKQKNDVGGKKREFADKGAHENLQRIVKQFEDFLNNDKGETGEDGFFADDSEEEDDVDEDESDDDEGEDENASFNEDDFTKLMQEMMGMPPEVMRELMSGKVDALKNGAQPSGPLVPPSQSKGHIEELDDSGSDADDGEDFQAMMKQMEAELRVSGALDDSTGPSSSMAGGKVLQRTATHGKVNPAKSDEGDLEQVDSAVAQNLLESLRSQRGTSGPAGNLMGQIEYDSRREKKPPQKK